MAEIAAMKNKGMNQAEIAREWGVTRQAISAKWNYYGGRRTPRQEALDHFPFHVPALMQQTAPFRLLRHHAEYVVTNGIGMSDDKLKRLRSFYRKLREGFVLEYDPNIPPIEGVSNKGGWAYRERKASDGDLLIRVNEYTDLSDRGRWLWRLPPSDP